MSKIQQALGAISDVVESDEFEQFRINAEDFFSARDHGGSEGTQIEQMTASLGEVAEIVNRSFAKEDSKGERVNIVSPVVIPRGGRSFGWLIIVAVLFVVGAIGVLSSSFVFGTSDMSGAIFGIHYWILLALFTLFQLWKNSFVMIPDGCQALITKFGKLEAIVGSGRTWLLHPWKKVSYIVSTTKEYPYNAPIHEAPTEGRVNASVDLFLQFRVDDPGEFIFTLGSTMGFTEKLQNAISEVTRSLIYEQKAESIYDLVGESTQPLLDTLNNQFLPAVRFVNANITHAEPSNQQYRMDLAAPEMVRVAKEAYTYEYELKLRKEQDEGELNKELASLRETLSDIRAEIAKYQAQMDTARERETNRANAHARQMMIEAESGAKANSALLEAQALDIRAMSSASYPEIIEYRFQQDTLNKIAEIAHNLPQIVHVGSSADQEVDFMEVAHQMLGVKEQQLYTPEEIHSIRQRMSEIRARVQERAAHINKITPQEEKEQEGEHKEPPVPPEPRPEGQPNQSTQQPTQQPTHPTSQHSSHAVDEGENNE
jgi:regulator of protease activity HflC (stomatin/prohibitin superfamily)